MRKRAVSVFPHLAGVTSLVLALLLSGGAQASRPDGWQVEGQHGQLAVHGMLTEGACRLEMASGWQDVDLGETSSLSLLHPGDKGPSVPLVLTLRDCTRTRGSAEDRNGGMMTRDTVAPVVTVSFSGREAPAAAQLIQLDGVSGAGLRITDSQHRDVRVDGFGIPQPLTPGRNELVYRVAIERTTTPLVVGRYHATVDFKLDYH